ncbi:Metallophosphoesterase [Akanthomyces lecanii RCEF 1005]|uniref:Metallophosphoesterase n=1 Tax=Akanthomyces lecanii RCEF 1005 TaxID=1081108 RepID=A0A168GJQ7_CORDF|nr:Metallophosphoesterase [Akanthomyces lecanii RCEF 1005]
MELTAEKASVKSSIFMLSDTHGMTLDGRIPDGPIADVCVHAGDLTEESKLEEFHSAITLLRSIDAPLKLVIAGNHDFTLDTPSFEKKIQEIKPPLDPELVKNFYGDYEEAKQLLLNAKEDHGIHLLSEGTHDFVLQNGGKLRVYASPYTPSLGDWGFQYSPNEGHNFAIEVGTNIVITHGPPRGILDRTNTRERAGCPGLFAAVAKAKPQIHCFGHIHEGWGAKLVAWRRKLSEKPSFLTDIENSASLLVEQLGTLHETKFDSPEDADAKKEKLDKYTLQKFCTASVLPEDEGDLSKTLFVNASIKSDSPDTDLQLPWLVDVMLPRESDTANSAAPSHKDIAAASYSNHSPKDNSKTGLNEGHQNQRLGMDSVSSNNDVSAKSDRRKLPVEGRWYTKKTAGKKRSLEMDQAEDSQSKTRRKLPGDRR